MMTADAALLQLEASSGCTREADGWVCVFPPDTVRTSDTVHTRDTLHTWDTVRVLVPDTARLRVIRDSLGAILAQRDATIVALRDTIARLRAPTPPPAPAPSDTIFTDGFESGLNKWADVTRSRVSTAQSKSGTSSLELPYAVGNDGGWAWRKQLVPDNVAKTTQYLRWWQRWSPGFRWKATGGGDQKLFLLEGLSPQTGWSQTASWKVYLSLQPGTGLLLPNRFIWAGGTDQWAGQWQTLPLNVRPRAYVPDQWTCTEVELAHNTPGQADGTFRVWINDTLVAQHVNVKFRDAAVSWNAIQLSAYYDGGSPVAQTSWVDDVMVGRSRIGCGPLPAPSPTPTPVPTPTPPAGALFSEDFSTYRTTAELMSGARWNRVEEFNAGQISLDTTTGHGTSTRSMRYTYPNRQSSGSRCSDYTIGRTLNVNAPNVWVEFWIKFSTNFSVAAPGSWGCASGQELKLIFGLPSPATSRWNLEMQPTRWIWGYPGNEAAQIIETHNPRSLLDGQWHRLRLEMHAGSGPQRVWIDNQLVGSLNANPGRSSISGIGLARTLNQGPGQEQYLWWGRIVVYTTNPGW